MPTPGPETLTLPLEGPRRLLTGERINYREDPAVRLPEPEELPEAPDDLPGADLEETPIAACPTDWQLLNRFGEKFQICYPQSWVIGGGGYVTAGRDDRWHGVGLFLFDSSARQRAHVSIYTMGHYSKPVPYTSDCPQAYGVTLAGRPAVICPDFTCIHPEGKIIAYHVRTDEFDYFVNVVLYLEYDTETRVYGEGWPQDLEQEAIQVARTFTLTRQTETAQ